MAYKLVKKLSTGQLADYTEEIRDSRPDNIGPMQQLPGPEYATVAIAAARESNWFVNGAPSEEDVRNMDYLEEAEPLAIAIVELYEKYTLTRKLTEDEKKSSNAQRQSAQ